MHTLGPALAQGAPQCREPAVCHAEAQRHKPSAASDDEVKVRPKTMIS